MLDKAGIEYSVIDAEENKELTQKMGVIEAPTLIVPVGDVYEKYVNPSNIRAFIEEKKG